MVDASTVATVPVQPLFAEGRILAGFLDEQSAATCPEFARAPASDQNRVREKFGAAKTSSIGRPAVAPKFRQVQEQEALAVLGRFAARCGGPLVLNNLVGFEWVEIARIVAGRYVAAPMPRPGRYPISASSIAEIANYCLAGAAIVPEQDLTIAAMPAQIVVISPEGLRLQPFLHSNPGPQGGLLLEYIMQREPSPISVLYADDRLVALTHQERLVALLEAGIREALCLVHYGYGTEALGLLNNLEVPPLGSQQIPYVEDFLNPEIAVTVPVAKPRVLITFAQHTTDLTVFE